MRLKASSQLIRSSSEAYKTKTKKPPKKNITKKHCFRTLPFVYISKAVLEE